MHQLARLASRRNQIEPPARGHARRQAQHAVGDGVTVVEVGEKPAIDLAGPKLILNRFDVRHDWLAFVTGTSLRASDETANLFAGNAAHFHALRPAALAGQDSNSRKGDVQMFGEQAATGG